MNFTNVRGILIPDGNVKRLSSNGNVLWKKSAVPDGYTEVEALIAFGGQWIDTGITLTSEDEIKIDLTISDLSEPTFLIMGSRGAYQDRNITFSKQSSGYGIVCDFNNGNGNNYRFGTDQYTTGRFQMFNNKNSRGVVGLGQNTNVCTDSFTCPGTCCVGFWGAGTSATSLGVIGGIYSAEITGKWKGVPCYRDSDGELGMYDLVHNQFHPNAGIGSFSAIYKDFTPGYTQLRAIIATGQQWFDLGFKGNQNIRIDLNLRPTALQEPDAQIWAGSYDGLVNYYIGPGGRSNFHIYWSPNVSNSYIEFTQQTYPLVKSCQAGPTKAANTFYVFPNSKSFTKSTFETSLNIWMFNRSSVNGQYSNLPARCTCYSGRFWNNTTVIRNLVPAMRNNDNEPGLLDMKNNFFYQSMTGTPFNYVTW